MSEQLHTPHHEHQVSTHETLKQPERQVNRAEKARAETPQEHVERLAAARSQAHEHASTKNPVEKLRSAEKAAAVSTPQHINRELKQITLHRELGSIRHQLSKPQQTLSRVIHQPTVQAVSEATSKTVGRPSGLLGGGLVALVGTTSYLYLAKHIGFQYNYGVFLVLFAGGFALGLGLELVVHITTASRRRND